MNKFPISVGEIYEEVARIAKVPYVRIAVAGYSSLGIPIPYIHIESRGPRCMIVARQHGSEPTGTIATLKLLEEIVLGKFSTRCSLAAIPVSNPDGAMRFEIAMKSRPKLGYKLLGLFNFAIGRTVKRFSGDLNRDHDAKEFRESEAIAKVIEEFKPDFLLDLHNFPPEFNIIYQKRTKLKWYDFCAIVPLIGKEPVRKKARELAEIAYEGVRNAGGNPMPVGGITDVFIYRAVKYLPITLDSWCVLRKDIPAVTFETWGGFHTGLKYIQHGARLHLAAVKNILKHMEQPD